MSSLVPPGIAAVMAVIFSSFFAMSVTVRPKISEKVGNREDVVEPSSFLYGPSPWNFPGLSIAGV